MSAPISVSAPAHAHTISTPVVDGTAPETSEGCTKIDAPMIVPTTIAVARPSPIARMNWAEAGGPGEGECKRGKLLCQPHARQPLACQKCLNVTAVRGVSSER